jgi:uncharacterized protein
MAEDPEKSKVVALRPNRPCPECKRESSREFWPFCSRRCKEVDMNRWLSGAYAIPVRDDEDEDQTSTPEES